MGLKMNPVVAGVACVLSLLLLLFIMAMVYDTYRKIKAKKNAAKEEQNADGKIHPSGPDGWMQVRIAMCNV